MNWMNVCIVVVIVNLVERADAVVPVPKFFGGLKVPFTSEISSCMLYSC